MRARRAERAATAYHAERLASGVAEYKIIVSDTQRQLRQLNEAEKRAKRAFNLERQRQHHRQTAAVSRLARVHVYGDNHGVSADGVLAVVKAFPHDLWDAYHTAWMRAAGFEGFRNRADRNHRNRRVEALLRSNVRSDNQEVCRG